ncbi:MAG: amidohydrolase family protein [Phycisphaeraceae bacterium]
MGTVFRNAILVQLDPPRVETGALRQDDGKITSLGTNVAAEDGDENVDCAGAVLMPGLVNGHTHLYSALAAGMPAPPKPPTNFHEILRFVWWRLDRAHTLESVEYSGRIGALAALRCGTTTLIDHHASPNAIEGSLNTLEQGIASVGCRGVLCYETTDRNRPDEAGQGLEENERYVRTCHERDDGRFAGMVGAHASFTLTEDSLAGCVDLAKRLNVGVHIHTAEDPVDERLTRESISCGLFERFDRHGLLDVPGTILAHGTHFSDRDIGIVNERRQTVTMAHNPRSNMNNGVGYTPVARFAKPPMLGTDGIGADMWDEARTALFKSNDAHKALPFERPLQMLGESARFASRCLGIPLGVLEAGAAADLVLTGYRPATPLTAKNLAGHLIFALGAEFVRDVMIGGQWCLRGGRVLTCDEVAVSQQSMEVARDLHQRMSQIPCE